MELDRYETARRMRALRGYSLLSQEEFAEAVDIPRDAAERYMRSKGPTRTPEDVLRRAAVAVGLPDDFAVGVFGVHESAEEATRIAALEDQVAHLLASMPTEEQLRTIVAATVAAKLAEAAARSDSPGRPDQARPEGHGRQGSAA
jgi:transcriptional regulator with XRE-family HTH domain